MRRSSAHTCKAIVVALLAALGCAEGSPLDSVDNPGNSLAVSPAEPQTVVGGTLRLTAIGLDQQGVPTGPVVVRWESRDTTIAVVSSKGEVTGLRPGHTIVTAFSTTDHHEVELVVAPGSVGSIDLTPVEATIAVGATVQLR